MSKPLIMMILSLSICCLALLAGFAAEYLCKLKPCVLCWYQRYAYMAGFGLSTLFLLVHKRSFSALIGFWGVLLSFATNAFFATYQVLIEQKLITVPSLCKGVVIERADSFEAFQNKLKAAGDHVPCDQIPWDLFGISMAGYNAALTIGITMILLYVGCKHKTMIGHK